MNLSKKLASIGLSALLALGPVLHAWPVTVAAAPSSVEVTTAASGASIENEYLGRHFSIENGRLATASIENKRTNNGNTVLAPLEGSEEFTIRLVAEEQGDTQPPTQVLDRTGWAATVTGSDGTSAANPNNMLDGNWDTIAECDRGGSNILPFSAVFNLNGPKTFQSFAYVKRPGNSNPAWGVNGTVVDYEFHISDDGENWTKISEGTLADTMYNEGNMYNLPKRAYGSFSQPYTASYVKLVATDVVASGGYYSFTCGEFELYEDPGSFPSAPTQEIRSSELELLNENAVTVTSIEGGKKLSFAYKPYEANGIPWSVTYNIVMYEGDFYMRSFLELSVPDEYRSQARIDYIDCDSLLLPTDIPEEALWSRRNDIPSSHLSSYYMGLGQPVYVNGLFIGSEFPITETRLVNNAVRMRYYSGKSFEQLETTTDGKFVTWQTVVGAARSSDYEVVQTDFFEYIDNIATPTDFRVQFNSWFDYEHGITPENLKNSFLGMERGLTQSGFEPIDSYVADDGWNDYTGDFWNFKDVFPNGMQPTSELVSKLGASFGMWLSPRGGYDYTSAFARQIEAAGNGAVNNAANDIDVNHPVYLQKTGEMMGGFQNDYNVEYWKLDGFAQRACTNPSHGHMVGGYEGMYYMVETWENWTDIFEQLRASREAQGKGLFLNLTSYTPPSPWMLQWGNTLFLQTTNDAGFAGPTNTDYGNRMLTHRDNGYYSFYVSAQLQVPMKNIYNHDPVYGKKATRMLGVVPVMDTDAFRNYLFTNAVRGTSFWELYYSYDLLDEEKWMVNTEALRFAKDNIDVLSKAKMIASATPSANNGTPYAFSAWGNGEGFLSVRNPSASTKTFNTTLDRLIGVPETMAGLSMTYVLPNEVNPSSQVYNYGDAISVTLQPFETRILKFAAKDIAAPSVVRAEVTGSHSVRVTFNEYVNLTEDAASIGGYEITAAKLLADNRTVEITVGGNGFAHAEAVAGTLPVQDASGNAAALPFEAVHYINRVVNTVAGLSDLAEGAAASVVEDPSVNATVIALEGEPVSPAKPVSVVSSAKMSVSLLAKTSSAGTTLLAQDGAYRAEINASGKLVFSVGNLTVTSETTVNDNAWHALTFVKEVNGMLKIYVDGELDASVYVNANERPVPAGELSLGSAGFTGQIANVVFSDDALDYEEIQNASENIFLGSLNGEVTGIDGKLVAGAQITLQNNTQNTWQTTSDKQGHYTFENIPAASYKAKVEAKGYDALNNVPVSLAVGQPTEQSFALTMKNIADYVNGFDDGDVSNLLKLPSSTGAPTVELVEHNGSNAAKVTFSGTGNSARSAVYDSLAPQLQNGLLEVDITPLNSALRFGTIMRATDIRNLVLTSYQDSDGSYFGEYFTSSGGNGYTTVQTGPVLEAGGTYHLKMETSGNTTKLWVDGELVINYTNSGLPAGAGYIGFHCAKSDAFVIDNIEVTSYDPPAEGTTTLTGSATNTLYTDSPYVNGAQVTLLNGNGQMAAQTLSNARGEYTLKNIMPGQYTLQASAQDYLPYRAEVTVGDDGNTHSFAMVCVEELQALYELYKNMENTNYTPASWETFQDALTAAKNTLENAGSSQQQVNDATSGLQSAFEGLQQQQPTDKTQLEALYNGYKDTVNDNYTTDSWSAFQNALGEAKTVLDNGAATQQQVDDAQQQLQAAYDGLTKQTGPGDVEVESVKINLGALTNLKYGKPLQLDVIINPSNATNKELTFTSSNNNVLTVNKNGVLTGIKPGTARVTATAHNGISHTVTIRVTA